MASNVQAGTRGLSAGDWVRLKRLRGARNFQADKVGTPNDIVNPRPTLIETTQKARRVFTEFGTSKVRRPASFWTDYRLSQTADYVLETRLASCSGPSGPTVSGPSRVLTAHVVCNGTKQTNCVATGVKVITHNGICMSCKNEKRTNLQPLAQQPSCTTCGS